MLFGQLLRAKDIKFNFNTKLRYMITILLRTIEGYMTLLKY